MAAHSMPGVVDNQKKSNLLGEGNGLVVVVDAAADGPLGDSASIASTFGAGAQRPVRRAGAVKLLGAAQKLYDAAHRGLVSSVEVNSGSAASAVSEKLVVKGFTHSQVWSQLLAANQLSLALAGRWVKSAAEFQELEELEKMEDDDEEGNNGSFATSSEDEEVSDASSDTFPSDPNRMMSLSEFTGEGKATPQGEDEDSEEEDVDDDEEQREDLSTAFDDDEDDDEEMKLDSDLEEENSQDEDEEEEEKEVTKSKKSSSKETYVIPKVHDGVGNQMKGRRTEVDEGFFTLEAMERFADFGEARDMKSAERLNKLESKMGKMGGESEDEDDVEDVDGLLNKQFDFDLDRNYDDLESDEELDGDNVMYEDFFGKREDENPIERKPDWQTSKDRVFKKDHPAYPPKKDDTQQDDDEQENLPEEHFGREEDEVEEDDDNNNENGLGFDDMEDAIPESDDENQGPDSQRDLFGDDEEEEYISDGEGGKKKLSKFELEQKRIQEQIDELEEEAVGEKDWQMKGEARSKSRPSNSLLEEDLITDVAAKPVPVITEETTQLIEDLIIQRIKDNTFDDVVRRAAPKNIGEYDPNKRIEIDDSKSKKSLTEIYEDDHKKQVDPTMMTEKDEKLKAQHDEIAELYKSLCTTLDALCN